MQLRLFSDTKYRLDRVGHVPILFPFWGRGQVGDPSHDIFATYLEIGPSLFQMTSLEEADLAILPSDWKWYRRHGQEQLAFEFVSLANRAGKPVVVFLYGDVDEPLPFDAYIFRSSLYRSERRVHEYALPSWPSDIVSENLNGNLVIRSKQSKPTVGFCGKAKWDRQRRLRYFARLGAELIGVKEKKYLLRGHHLNLRVSVLRRLSKCADINTNFVLRTRYWGGSYSSQSDSWNLDLKEQVRKEFVDNMVESDYIVCVRGEGNYSVRFYETLMCGRIPLFIDTDCVLPYDFVIDWKKYCVWVDYKERSTVARQLIAFHEALSDDEFIELQRQERTLWEQWLSPHGFFSNFHRHFEEFGKQEGAALNDYTPT